MTLQFEQFSEATDPALLLKAAALTNGEIYQDGTLRLDDLTRLCDPTEPGTRVYGVTGGDDIASVAVVEDMSIYTGATTPDYELTAIAVQPEYQRQGLGAYTLRQVERQVAALGGTALRIGVTIASAEFYKKQGYAAHATQEGYVTRRIRRGISPEPQLPQLRDSQDVIAGGNLAEMVALGNSRVHHSLSEVLMARVFVCSALDQLMEVADADTESGHLVQTTAAAGEALGRVAGTLEAAMKAFSEYYTYIAGGDA
jgi:GNAT superfamily N-acetyltransferase